jgi:hypothetical protein
MKSIKSIRAEFHRKVSKANKIKLIYSEPLKFEALVEKFKEQEKKGQDEEVQAI